MEEVRQSYEAIFPTLLGVQLSNRLKDTAFKGFLKRVDEVDQVDDARARAMVSEFSDKLKSDQFMQYTHQLTPISKLYRV